MLTEDPEQGLLHFPREGWGVGSHLPSALGVSMLEKALACRQTDYSGCRSASFLELTAGFC